MADMYYYNGVLLPEIPAEAIAEAPYCWIRHNGTEVSCFCSSNPNYLKSDGTISPSKAAIFYKYDFDAVTNLWKLFTRWGAATGGWGAIIDGWNLLWSNHDIPNGSADSTTIYFPAMKAYRAVDVFTPDTLAISKDRLKGFADQVRRISGVEGELTPEQMETNLLNVTVGADLPNAEAATFGVGPVAAELPDDYQIQRTTMDNIAEEVQRLTGATDKLTTAQIQSSLESVVLQEKTVTPTSEQQEIVPDEGYYGISKVTVEAVEDSGGEVTLPENARLYYVGNANSSLDMVNLIFESNAVGALSE